MSIDRLLHLAPPFFAILICVFSLFDHLYINEKVASDPNATRFDTSEIELVKKIANGAADLSVHILNVLLFIVGIMLAILDWPHESRSVPVVICIVLLLLVVYDVIINGIRMPLSDFESLGLGKIRLSFGGRLRLEQAAFSIVILILISIGMWLHTPGMD